jgi:hypothetical protein
MSKQNADTLGAGMFLVGLGVLFLLDWFWPGILALLGIVALVTQWARGNHLNGLSSLVLLGGLTILFAVGFAWEYVFPIGLIVLGLIALVKALRGW